MGNSRGMKVGSLCSGIGGLELGLELVGYDIELVWRSDIEKEINRWADVRLPGIPNLGDLTSIDSPPPVDLITAGFPCQPVSQAGEQKGVEDERWLFDDIAALVGAMESRPWLFLENVPGLLSTGDGEPLRRVVHGLAQIGYVGQYGLMAASEIGAPHRRKRWFCIARPADSDPERWGRWARWAPGGWPESEDEGGDVGDPDDIGGEGRHTTGQQGETGPAAGRPAASDADEARLQGSESTERRLLSARGSSSVADPDSIESERRRGSGELGGSSSAESGEGHQRERSGDTLGDSGSSISDTDADGREERGVSTAEVEDGETVRDVERSHWFGPYWPAIQRWEAVLGRECPATPLEHTGRLNAEFVEFIMGYDHGYVTELLNRRPSIRALGNSVVPQQAAAAWEALNAR